jgi:hypothetical protein
MNTLQREASKTYTENGDVTFSTTANANLDFFGSAGALRGNPTKVIDLFSEAVRENKETAILNMFHLRDARGGVGEREAFRKAYKVLAMSYPEDAIKLMPAVVEYGRWDDLFCLLDLHNGIINEALVNFISKQLYEDIGNMRRHKSVSLCAKWMPSINTSSKKARKTARFLANKMGCSARHYRYLLSTLRRYIDILERHMSTKDYTFDYSKLPAKALMKHTKAFLRHDSERYTSYKADLSNRKVKAKTSVLYPHEIINMSDTELRESVWRDIKRHVGDTKTIVVRDGSGSMTCLQGGNVRPLDVATSLAILFSEQLTGAFKDRFITFSRVPELVDLSRRTTLKEKLDKCRRYNSCENTDIMAVYRLILDVEKNCDPKDWIDRIVIISDMQFDYGTRNVPTYEEAKRMFDAEGIPLPTIVYWNVASRVDFPSSNLKNVRFVSGFSQHTIKAILENKGDTAIEYMYHVLAKYQPVLELLS